MNLTRQYRGIHDLPPNCGIHPFHVFVMSLYLSFVFSINIKPNIKEEEWIWLVNIEASSVCLPTVESILALATERTHWVDAVGVVSAHLQNIWCSLCSAESAHLKHILQPETYTERRILESHDLVCFSQKVEWKKRMQSFFIQYPKILLQLLSCYS